MQKLYATTLLLCAVFSLSAQQGFFSGSFQSNTNFFICDTNIGASGLPHYDKYKVGTEGWLNLNYTNEKWGLEVGSRVDLFYNSIVKNPNVPFSGAGLGIFYIKKRVFDLDITAGYFYTQLGSGIAYRSWEERPLGIDNSLLGAKLEYNVKDKLKLTAFTGVQKNSFTVYSPIITAFNADGNLSFKDGKVILKPGFSVLNRSMNEEVMNLIVSRIESQPMQTRFIPKYNVYVFTAYNTLTVGPVSWYVEGGYKTREAINAVDASLINRDGNILFTSLSYSTKGFGITGQFKRVENWVMRTSPNENPVLFQGLLSFIPPVSRQNSLRLPARYFAPSQELSELSFGLEGTYSPNRKLKFTLSGSHIRDFLLKSPLRYKVEIHDTISDTIPMKNFFSEAYIDMHWKINSKIELEVGFQFVHYNATVYRQSPEDKIYAFTPFVELGVKINKKVSLRTELQAQLVPDFERSGGTTDYGHWLYALVELSIAPRWSFAVSDMWNFDPNEHNVEDKYGRRSNHYYSVFTAFTHKSTRFTLAYVRQVPGIVCTGGVCRFEPAFSGVKLGVNTTF